MRVPTIILAVAAVELGSTALADPYKDLAAQGYRWVIVDGPYACPSKDDLREITRHRTDLLEVKMVSDLRPTISSEGLSSRWSRRTPLRGCRKSTSVSEASES
jgi:hypothetical protein